MKKHGAFNRSFDGKVNALNSDLSKCRDNLDEAESGLKVCLAQKKVAEMDLAVLKMTYDGVKVIADQAAKELKETNRIIFSMLENMNNNKFLNWDRALESAIRRKDLGEAMSRIQKVTISLPTDHSI